MELKVMYYGSQVISNPITYHIRICLISVFNLVFSSDHMGKPCVTNKGLDWDWRVGCVHECRNNLENVKL